MDVESPVRTRSEAESARSQRRARAASVGQGWEQ